MKSIPRDSHHIEHLFQEELLEKLWEPVKIGGLTLRNRIALAPIQRLPPENVWPDMHETHIIFHEAVARGGAGLIVVGEADVTPNSAGAFQTATGERRRTKGIWTDDAIRGWARLIDACHKWGAKVFPQLSSYAPWLSKIATTRGGGEAELLIPNWKDIGMTPDALQEEVQNFVAAALRAKEAGADGVELAGTRESLIATLVSGVRNPGTPGYSEGVKERARFASECIRQIKEVCGENFPVMIRLSAVEYIDDGYDTEYSKLVAKEYVDAGVDAVDVVQAGFSTRLPQLQMVAPPGTYSHDSRVVKSYLASLGRPYSDAIIGNACRIQNPWLAASLIRNGDCDIVSICRQHIIDPDWPNKIKEGRVDDIIPCTGCGWCMRSFTCAVNPQSPFYKSPELVKAMTMTRAQKVKKVLVAGGGLAGMEASRALALRGHKVTLYEKEKDLGRMIYIQSLAPYRNDIDLMRKYLSTQIKKLRVDIRCSTEVTPELVEKEEPDVVIVATGCRPKRPEVPGLDKYPHVVNAEDVLLEKVDIGRKVVVLDADPDHDLGSMGSFAAQYVARAACLRDDLAIHIMRWSPTHTPDQIRRALDTPSGREVTLVTETDRIAEVHYHHYTTSEDLRRMGVNVFLACRYKEVTDKGVVIINKDGKEEFLEADTIITSDYEPNDKLYKELEGKVRDLFLVGDAKNVQLNFIANIHGPYRLAITI